MGRYVFAIFFGHDSSVALVGEGKIAHLEVERFTRVKHDWSVPREEVVASYLPILLRLTGASLDEVSALVEVGCGDGLGAGRVYRRGVQHWGRDLVAWDEAPSGTYLGPSIPCYYLPHHLAHAAYAFYTSEHASARVVAIDGGGDAYEGASGEVKTIDAAVGCARHDFESSDCTWRLDVVEDVVSVGGMWGSFAREYCNNDWFAAGTVMAMLGVPEERFEELCALKSEDRSRMIALQDYTTRVFHRLSPPEEVAASGGAVCMAGGCALNGVAAYDLLRRRDVHAVHVPPAVHDGGLTVGAALFCLHAILREPRRKYAPEDVAFSGYADEALAGYPPAEEVANLLASGKVVAVASGRAESGPRALGHRSILADPRSVEARDRLNRIKGRRPFRPTAPVILREYAGVFFDLVEISCYSFMTMIATARERALQDAPAGVHLNGTARVQIVESGSDLGKVVNAFYARTGVPIVLNTSFNLRGEAMVNDAAQARDTFRRSDIDALAIGETLRERP